MMTTAEATAAIAAAMRPFAAETIATDSAAGRVLQQPVTAERDQPPFDRVTMDGIAVAWAAIESGARRFRIAARQHAGDPPVALARELCGFVWDVLRQVPPPPAQHGSRRRSGSSPR